MRRFARITGTLLAIAGVAVLVWVVVVWRWQDPFTALYTTWRQHQLSDSYKRKAEAYQPPPVKPGASLAATTAQIRAQARRYRLNAKRGEGIGRIRVPRLGLNMVFVEGTDDASLRKGPGRDRRTYMPGEGQLVYIAGHRTTYGAPFAKIDRLAKGDKVFLELPYGTFEYRVTGHRIVPATQTSELRSRGIEQLALQACHPRFFATERYIVYATPVRVTRRGTEAAPLANG